MIHYLDSSALVKRYLREPGTDLVASLWRSRRRIAVSRLVEVEVPLALARCARRGDLDRDDARAQVDRFLDELGSFAIVEVRPRTISTARELGWKHELRSYDAVHLAGALQIKNETSSAITFWCADAALSRAALAEGLRGGEVPR